MNTLERITLHSPGPIPGIPGEHAPGTYYVDWQERTITPVILESLPVAEVTTAATGTVAEELSVPPQQEGIEHPE